MNIERTEQEIEDVIEWARQGIQQGTRYAGQSYEQGIEDTLRWITGDTDERPDQDGD